MQATTQLVACSFLENNMTFLKVAEGVFVNTANVLKFEITSDSVTIHLVGQSKPVSLVANDPEATAHWMEWLAPNTVNIASVPKVKS